MTTITKKLIYECINVSFVGKNYDDGYIFQTKER